MTDYIQKFLKLVTGGTILESGSPLGGSQITPEIHQMIARGMGRQATVGGFSTGIVGGGNGTVLDLDQPEFVIGVPSGYAIMPLRLSAQVQVGLFAADNDENEILFAVDSKGVWSLDGTYTAESPSNMRSDKAFGSSMRVASAFTADMTTTPAGGSAADPVLDMELARAVETGDIFSTGVQVFLKRLDLLYEPQYPPLIVGPASICCYWGGTVATIGGFLQAAWLEGTTDQFYLAT